MNNDSPQDLTQRQATQGQPQPTTNADRGSAPPPRDASKDTASQPATVLVRGETVGAQGASAAPKAGDANGGKASPKKPFAAVKVQAQGRLPALDDDGEIGVQKDQVVVRDGKADLSFTGTLLASAAPASTPDDQWHEYRVYETSAGKFVFSKVTRHLALDEADEHEAEIFEPEPTSKPAQLLRNARDLTRSHPFTWKDEAVDFFGYDPLAKALYRKLGADFEEHVS